MSQQKSLRKQLICFICLHVTLPSLGSELRFFCHFKGGGMSAERRRRVWKTSFGQQCFEVKMLITRKGLKLY